MPFTDLFLSKLAFAITRNLHWCVDNIVKCNYIAPCRATVNYSMK